MPSRASEKLETLLERGVQRSLTESESAAWATSIGATIPHGAVISLHGDLGTGKTTLARALCAGLNVLDSTAVTSPTFSIVHEYPVHPAGVVIHADLYRLRDAHDLDNLGWEELVTRARATIVEWPDRVPAAIPADAIHIRLAHDPENPEQRRITVD